MQNEDHMGFQSSMNEKGDNITGLNTLGVQSSTILHGEDDSAKFIKPSHISQSSPAYSEQADINCDQNATMETILSDVIFTEHETSFQEEPLMNIKEPNICIDADVLDVTSRVKTGEEESTLIENELQELTPEPSNSHIEVHLELEPSIICSEADNIANRNILDAQSSIIIDEEREAGIHRNLQTIDLTEFKEHIMNLPESPHLNSKEADINFYEEGIFMDDAIKQGTYLLLPVSIKYHVFSLGQN